MGERIVLLLEYGRIWGNELSCYLSMGESCCGTSVVAVAAIGWCLSMGKLSNPLSVGAIGAIEVLLVNNKSKQIAH